MEISINNIFEEKDKIYQWLVDNKIEKEYYINDSDEYILHRDIFLNSKNNLECFINICEMWDDIDHHSIKTNKLIIKELKNLEKSKLSDYFIWLLESHALNKGIDNTVKMYIETLKKVSTGDIELSDNLYYKHINDRPDQVGIENISILGPVCLTIFLGPKEDIYYTFRDSVSATFLLISRYYLYEGPGLFHKNINEAYTKLYEHILSVI